MEADDFGDVPEDEIRDAHAVARRALALFSVVSIALGADRERLLVWLKAEDLWAELSPAELEFVASASSSERQVINASWRSEALLLLLWALIWCRLSHQLRMLAIRHPSNRSCLHMRTCRQSISLHRLAGGRMTYCGTWQMKFCIFTGRLATHQSTVARAPMCTSALFKSATMGSIGLSATVRCRGTR